MKVSLDIAALDPLGKAGLVQGTLEGVVRILHEAALKLGHPVEVESFQIFGGRIHLTLRRA